EEDLFASGFQNLINVVEFRGLGEMADVSGVQQEFWRRGQSIDFVDGRFQGGGDIRVGGLVEAHVAVADLYEAKLAFGCGLRRIAGAIERVGLQHTALHYAERSRARPCHAFEKSAAVNSIVMVIVK